MWVDFMFLVFLFIILTSCLLDCKLLQMQGTHFINKCGPYMEKHHSGEAPAWQAEGSDHFPLVL